MAGGGPLPVREYGPGDVAEMRARATALRSGTFAPIATPSPRFPAPRLVETKPYRAPTAPLDWSKPIIVETTVDLGPHLFFPAQPTVRDIRNLVSRVTGIDVVHLCGARRAVPLVKARQIAFYLAQRRTNRSYPQIGKGFGGRDHTTIMHGCRRVASAMSALGIVEGDDVHSFIATMWRVEWPRFGK